MTPIAERTARVIGVGALALALIWPFLDGMRATPSSDERIGVRVGKIKGDSNDVAAQSVARDIAARLVVEAAPSSSAPVERKNSWPAIHAHFNVVPSAATRAVLGVANAAGVPVHWSDSAGVRDIAAAPGASAAPRATMMLEVQTRTASSASLVFRDAGGTLDSARASSLKLRAAQLRAPVRTEIVRDGQTVASAQIAPPTAVRVRDVLLYARAGWESKFVTAALEESGWVVEGTISISPTSRVRLGAPQAADTSRYSAVVVLDSGLANARTLSRFVAQGGGVVLAGEALRDAALASLSPARVEDDRPAIAGALLTDQPRRGLPAFHLAPIGAAIVMEAEGREPTVLVVRRGIGRVMAVGYRGTWHWRMEGREESADEHRRWWSEIVSAVAYAADTSTLVKRDRTVWPGDAAPVADLIARLGPPTPDSAIGANASSRAQVPLWLLYLVAAAALLVEWGLRRLRGAP